MEHSRKTMKCFPQSYITGLGELIIDRETNQYFRLVDCNTELDVKCKVIEWLSRPACKTAPYPTKKKNAEFNNRILNGINEYLGTEFTREDMYEIYTYLGNRCNHVKTREFIRSHYDMSVLRRAEDDL